MWLQEILLLRKLIILIKESKLININWFYLLQATVSSDIIQSSFASIVDLQMTRVVDGDLVKIMAWYDNEWEFTNQMIRQIQAI